jgi:hypothetical protein
MIETRSQGSPNCHPKKSQAVVVVSNSLTCVGLGGRNLQAKRPLGLGLNAFM